MTAATLDGIREMEKMVAVLRRQHAALTAAEDEDEDKGALWGSPGRSVTWGGAGAMKASVATSAGELPGMDFGSRSRSRSTGALSPVAHAVSEFDGAGGDSASFGGFPSTDFGPGSRTTSTSMGMGGGAEDGMRGAMGSRYGAGEEDDDRGRRGGGGDEEDRLRHTSVALLGVLERERREAVQLRNRVQELEVDLRETRASSQVGGLGGWLVSSLGGWLGRLQGLDGGQKCCDCGMLGGDIRYVCVCVCAKGPGGQQSRSLTLGYPPPHTHTHTTYIYTRAACMPCHA